MLNLSFSAVCVELDIGLLASEVLSTLFKPTIYLVIPSTVPVNVGLPTGAFKFNVVNVAADIHLFASVVLSTFI